jgi:sugar phosphate isomerase/epimerase
VSSITRREFTVRALGALAAGPFLRPSPIRAAAPSSVVNGVLIGAQSYSFRDRDLDGCLAGFAAVGLSGCELWQGHFEPPHATRDELRAWRLATPASYFHGIRSRFENAGIRVYAVNISFRDDWTDEEIAKGFDQAEALGLTLLTASSNQATVARVAPLAEKRGMTVAVHNHSHISPNEFATPDDFEKAIASSPAIAINLDIGHFTAANFDAVAFLRRHHDRIRTLHIKDRKRDQGPNVPLGEGDTPIVAVLRTLRDEKWPIPAGIEYEYKGGDTVDEVKKCYAYCRQALE